MSSRPVSRSRRPLRRLVQHSISGLLAGLVAACGGGGSASSNGEGSPPAGTVPSAPLIGTAAAGDARASISFTAPVSDGGSPITSYRASCALGASTTASLTATGTVSPIVVAGLSNGSSYSCSVTASNAVGASAASAAVSVTSLAPPAATGTAQVLCNINGSEYNDDESVRLTASYSWTCSGNARVLSANGLPNHEVGTFPGPGNPNTIAAVATSASYTLTPAAAAAATNVITSGYALNGVKLEPSTAGTCGDAGGSSCTQAGGTGSWNMEALGQSAFNFGTDDNNAHVQPNGAYHYHGMPERFITKLGKGTATMTLTGWAPDGFPIYARYGHVQANDAASGIKLLRSSYRLKASADSNRPATSTYPMGTFTQDYEYQAGYGDLDECNGRSGVTPEFPGGTYHYVITETFPFISRCVKGTPASIR